MVSDVGVGEHMLLYVTSTCSCCCIASRGDKHNILCRRFVDESAVAYAEESRVGRV